MTKLVVFLKRYVAEVMSGIREYIEALRTVPTPPLSERELLWRLGKQRERIRELEAALTYRTEQLRTRVKELHDLELEAALVVVDAAREMMIERETPDDRMVVMNLKKVRSAIRHFDDNGASWLNKTENVKGHSCENPDKLLEEVSNGTQAPSEG